MGVKRNQEPPDGVSERNSAIWGAGGKIKINLVVVTRNNNLILRGGGGGGASSLTFSIRWVQHAVKQLTFKSNLSYQNEWGEVNKMKKRINSIENQRENLFKTLSNGTFRRFCLKSYMYSGSHLMGQCQPSGTPFKNTLTLKSVGNV